MAGKEPRAGRQSGTRGGVQRGARSVRRFDATRLPSPAHYYHSELGTRLNGSGWVSAKCPFHDDKSPSLGVNLEHGGYRCHCCGASGGDVLAFHMARYGLSFRAAAEALGAWGAPL